jgi:hypothetical protein
MPRENSLSDFDGESLTSDEEVGVTEVPVRGRSPQPSASASPDRAQLHSNKTQKGAGSVKSSASRKTDRVVTIPPITTIPRQSLTPKDRFRDTVRKIIALSRTTAIIRSGGLGAEPGVDPRRHSAFVAFGNIRQKCIIDIIDYSAVRCSFGRMTNGEFVGFLKNREACAPEPWVKVRWINIGGISWDVISALALKYGDTRLHDLPHPKSELLSRYASSVHRRLASSARPLTLQGGLLSQAFVHPCPMSYPWLFYSSIRECHKFPSSMVLSCGDHWLASFIFSSPF